jgi:hypothetical protein
MKRSLHPLLSFLILGAVTFGAAAQNADQYAFSSEKEARHIITLISDVVGLKPNFEIRSGDVSNAAAVIHRGKRYIIYNPVFISQIKNAVKTDWGGISIMAHEVGHHLNGHTLMGSGSTPAIELEADEFSGFVLRKMGATLAESQGAMRLISDERGSRTHPGRNARLASIQAGWRRADIQIASALKSTKPPAMETVEPKLKETIVNTRYTFPQQHILRNIHLYALPDEQFHITVKNNVVRVTDKGYQVIGKLVKSGRSLYLTFDSKIYLKLTQEGYVVNSLNRKVGYLRKASA